MKRDGYRTGRRAALSLALALGAGSAAISPALAQDALPSVSDYHLPSPAASPRARAQGPIDTDAPVVIAPPAARSASESGAPPAAASSASQRARPSQPARAPAARPSSVPAVSAGPTPTQAPRPVAPKPAVSAPAAAPQAIATSAPAPANDAPAAPATPAPSISAAPTEWHIHSAADETANQTGASWPWFAGLAFLLGAGVMLLGQLALRRRRAAAASAADWDIPAEAPALPVTSAPVATQDRAPADLAPARPVPQPPQPSAPPVFDLLSIMAEPEHVDAAPVPAQPLPLAVPVGMAEPLALELSARRLSATLMNTVLNYELTVSNTGPDVISSIIVGGDMIGAHASLPSRSQLELSGNAITPLHNIAALAPGENVVLKGEFKLALAAITPIRNGNAALFIPLARFRVEALRKSAVPLVVSRTFVVGEDQDRPGAALRPFRLDLGPRLYSQIGQRELALST